VAQALQIHAGPRAREWLRARGLRPADVAVIPAAAGGPKGLVLNPLDRFLFGHWLPRSDQVVHLLGASIGSWRMAAACLADPVTALAELAEGYVTQTYPHEPGKLPNARTVTRLFTRNLEQHLGVRADEVLASPRYRLHVFTSRGRHLLHRPGQVRNAVGYLGAYLANAASRRALGGWLERVVFSDPRDPLPLALEDFPTRRVELTRDNLTRAVLASCSVPFALEPVQDLPGAPRGTYWDGGITDYHLHLNYASMAEGLVLYPHFQRQVVPGWLDKAFRGRHRATPALDNLIVLAPHPDWVARLPGAKLPDRSDFKTWRDDEAARMRAWRRALAESGRLADEFEDLTSRPGGIEALPLA
jgi:Patatin-like phospholipase